MLSFLFFHLSKPKKKKKQTNIYFLCRSRVEVQLTDGSATLMATALGQNAEKLLSRSAKQLFENTSEVLF